MPALFRTVSAGVAGAGSAGTGASGGTSAGAAVAGAVVCGAGAWACCCCTCGRRLFHHHQPPAAPAARIITAIRPSAKPRFFEEPLAAGAAATGTAAAAGAEGGAEIGGAGGGVDCAGRVVTVAICDCCGPAPTGATGNAVLTVASSNAFESNVRFRLLSAFSTSFMDCQRAFGSFGRQRLMIASSSGGVSGATSANGFTSSRRTDESVEMLEPPSKARRPLTISYNTEPKEKISERAS